jgi:YafQ family addiction module toxin component
MYSLLIKPTADKIFQKLAKKNKRRLTLIFKKTQEIRENPNHKYKFLKKPLQNFNRVHINSNFVLIFKIDHKKKIVELFFFGHHDEVYKWRPND